MDGRLRRSELSLVAMQLETSAVGVLLVPLARDVGWSECSPVWFGTPNKVDSTAALLEMLASAVPTGTIR